jgi:hypothetical protein
VVFVLGSLRILRLCVELPPGIDSPLMST